MKFILLAAQLAAAPPVPDTVVYASEAVRRIVTEASRLNSAVPASFGRYRASVESEVSYGNQAGDREISVSLEQLASTLTWTRTGEFEQRVIGYRSQALGPAMSTLGFFRNAWTVPSLYGNRLHLLFGYDSTRRARAVRASRTPSRATAPYVAVHPLGVDRERYYRFAGGDTVQHILVDGRSIWIIRVDVEPRDELPSGTYFSGEINLDAERGHVVRMRGSFLSTRRTAPGPLGLFRLTQLDGIAYVELVNAEVEQAYWLPSYQRFEAHAIAPTLSDAKAVFRIVSRFRDYVIDPPAAVPGVAETDTLQRQPHRLTIAPRDSLARFGDWRDDIGAASANLSATDFDSVAPPRWRPNGPPVFLVQSERLYDLARFNRVEGLYTGLGVALRLRDAAPGVTARATAGYAWSEQAVRGRASAEWERNRWTYAARAGRSLDNTNDFRTPFDSGSTIIALFGVDDYDYVDRSFAGVSVSRTMGRDAWLARLELGWAHDRNGDVHATRSPFGGPAFLANRRVDEGGYARTAFTLRWHPAAAAEFMRTGAGATLDYLRGDGGLNFQRVEASFNARTNRGRWTLASRLDAGAAFGDVPPQQLFEIGSEHNLPGYEYKAFAGNQAAVLRGIAMFRTNLLTAPIHLYRNMWLPAVAPALTVSVQSGWTGVSNSAALASVARLGPRHPVDPRLDGPIVPASTITGNARASVAAGIRFFGGAIGLMMARAVDRAAPWKFRVDVGQPF